MIILTVFYILRYGQCDHAGIKQETASEDNCDFEEQDINAEEFVYFSNKAFNSIFNVNEFSCECHRTSVTDLKITC